MTSIVNHPAIREAFARWSRESEQRRKPSWRRDFTPDEIRAADIEAAREEGYRSGLAYAAKCARETQMKLLGGTTASALISAQALGAFAGGIEDALREPDHADA